MAGRKAKKVEEAPITPLKLPRGVKTLVVYGGSFDPPHEYHRWAWCAVRMTLGAAARTLFVPAASSPLKAHGPVASEEDRVGMLLADDNPPLDFNGVRASAGVWTDEIDRARWQRSRGEAVTPSYTIDTIHRLRQIIPERITLRLLIGSDQALAFHKWKQWRTLMKHAEPIVLLREPAATPDDLLAQLDAKTWSLRDRLAWAGRIAPYPPRQYSSTQVRSLLPRQPLAFSKWSDDAKLITKGVAKYIIKHRLYGVGTKCKPTQAPSRSAKGQRPKPRKK
jgi:nicotinate (nicotinamide) nucleotide adenylyltransferase